jgi:predicted site-specific integrase-resolvase
MINDKLLTVSEVGSLLNLNKISVRKIPIENLPVIYTTGKHRRYKESDVRTYMKIENPIINKIDKGCAIYARVSSNEQKTNGDLERQKNRLIKYCIDNKLKIVNIYEEVGSGMNDNRQKLHKLFSQVINKEIDTIICEHKDRLTRFNYKIYERFANSYDVQIIHVENVLPKSFETEIVEDMISLMASFSAKVYSQRGRKNKEKK